MASLDAEVDVELLLRDIDIEGLRKMKVPDLKHILRYYKECITGNKNMLVARCIALKSRLESANVGDDLIDSLSFDPLFDCEGDVDYDRLYSSAKGKSWTDDLRRLCIFNFHQLYDYLVARTEKIGDKDMKGACYKKLKSYAYFEEGNISSVEVARGSEHVWVKAKVMASMKKQQYRVIIVFRHNGDVRLAACQCPAGLGVNGTGKCNHVGGLLFAVNSFTTHGLQSNPEKVSCTSKINGWIVPRKLNVDPKPIEKIELSLNHSENSVYEPRAPQDRHLNVHEFSTLCSNLQDCAPSIGFFLFHEEENGLVQGPEASQYIEVESSQLIESSSQIIDESEIDQQTESSDDNEIPNLHYIVKENVDIPDDREIDEDFIKTFVDPIIANETIDPKVIKLVEQSTREQAGSDLWIDLRKYKITASHVGQVIKCVYSPQSLLKCMLYEDNLQSKYLTYGKANEQNAINAYQLLYPNVCIKKAGILISGEKPSLGASLDGIVEQGGERWGLEVKCPLSQVGKTKEEASKDPKFYLKECDKGELKLCKKHNYYFQIQTQLFSTKVQFVDFVVWFGKEIPIHVERIHFQKDDWYSMYLPKIEFFYRWAFLPELITRRVKRGLSLHTDWKKKIENLRGK